MSTKTPKKSTARGNGESKDGRATGRTTTQSPASSALALTERAWKKTYENRGKSKATA